MKHRVKLLASAAALLMFVMACRQSHELTNTSQLAANMSKDNDVIQFFQVLPVETKLIVGEVPMQQFAKYANDSAEFHRQVKLARQAATQAYQASLASSPQTGFLADRGQKFYQRYHLDRYSDDQLKDLYGKIIDQVDANKDRLLKKKTSKVSNPAARENLEIQEEEVFLDPDQIVYGENCTAWYDNIYSNGTLISSTYVFTTCPPPLGGPNPPVAPNVPTTYKNCEKERATRMKRCERVAQVAAAISMLQAVGTVAAAVVTTAGAAAIVITPGVFITFGAQITGISVAYQFCIADADEDYRKCLRENQGISNPGLNP